MNTEINQLRAEIPINSPSGGPLPADSPARARISDATFALIQNAAIDMFRAQKRFVEEYNPEFKLSAYERALLAKAIDTFTSYEPYVMATRAMITQIAIAELEINGQIPKSV